VVVFMAGANAYALTAGEGPNAAVLGESGRARGWLLAQASEPPLVAAPPQESGGPSATQQAKVIELERELAEERGNSRSMVVPIVELAVGLTFDIVTVAGILGAFNGMGYAALLVVAVAAISGAVFTILGVVVLVRTLALNARSRGRIDELEEELGRQRRTTFLADPTRPLMVLARF
jgi:hypothetical protein